MEFIIDDAVHQVHWLNQWEIISIGNIYGPKHMAIQSESVGHFG